MNIIVAELYTCETTLYTHNSSAGGCHHLEDNAERADNNLDESLRGRT